MAKSLAFWIDGNTSGKVPEIDLHINYWLLNQNTNHEFNYLDIGVRFVSLSFDAVINMYFPFKIASDQYIPGLGELICSRTDLIQTIFNARQLSTKNSSNTSVDIEFEGDGVLRIHKQIALGPQSGNVSIIDIAEGSILSFPLASMHHKVLEGADEPPGYFRFRINMDRVEARKEISQSYKHSDSFILSRLESTEIVDFRVNEVRDLPGIIQSKNLLGTENNLGAGIKNIHFFLIREVDSEFKQAHANFHRCRLLEKELWSDYLTSFNEKKVILPKQMLIYHWRESVDKEKLQNNVNLRIEKFNAFAKFGKITVTTYTFIWFILFALLLGAFGGILGDFLVDWLGPKFNAFNQHVHNLITLHFR